MKNEHNLESIAWRAMLERGLDPEFPPDAERQAESLQELTPRDAPEMDDLRGLLWCSVDNDDSRDLDQLTVCEPQKDGADRIHIAIADVDSLVKKDSPLDRHARRNTTSVYTAARIFPMLPERLSTDLTSLNPHEDRLAVVISYSVDRDGGVADPQLRGAWVRNKAKLAYNGVAAWLEDGAAPPEAVSAEPGMEAQLRIQDEAAQRLRARRHEHGALELETIEPRAVVRDGRVEEYAQERKNRARELIEDFMIAANGVTTRYLAERGLPTFRRVVRSPERWDRIERLAAEYGERLPPDPDSRALEAFLQRRRRADPLRFPDLSLAVIKMLGAGEYVVQMPGREPIGHFGLAVRDYSHSTAPNRRFPDVVTQRLLKAALSGDKSPYARGELDDLAAHCTAQEDSANRVERQVRKSAAALLLQDRIGDYFDALVTGATSKGTWVRALDPPVEGRLMSGEEGLDVGDRLTVRLVDTNVERGFIDFARAGARFRSGR